MIFQKAIKVTSGKTKALPEVAFFKLTSGVLTKLEIGFPAGCAGLVGIRVLRGAHQLFPMVESEWFVTDDYTISFPITQEVKDEPRTLKIEGYNQDTKNDHTITLRVSLERPLDVEKALFEVVSERLPERTEDYLAGIPLLVDVTEEVRVLLEEGVLPSMQEVLQLMKEDKDMKVHKMTVQELVVM